jgi:hypothetical protein
VPLTGPQQALLLLLVGLIPPIFGLVLPGGLVADSVELDFPSILIATWPWTLSIGAIAWIVCREPEGWSGWHFLGAAVGLLVAGAILGFAFTPEYTIALEQADDTEYYLLSELDSGKLAETATRVHGPPRFVALAVAFGAVLIVTFLYGLLYGPALWFAGLACGIFLGWRLDKAFPAGRGPAAPQ